jgi:GTP-sensing pleiotropic transcriptional regulator CodY
MFPLPINTYIYAGLVLLALAGFGYGRYEHNNYIEYKKEQEIIAKQQEAKVESIKQQQALVNKGIQDEYDAKLNFLRQYYANGVRQSSSSNLPSISSAKSIADATTAYTILAGQCAETTLMLVELQKWLNEQVNVK